MRLLLRMVALACLLTSAAWPGFTQDRGGRYDQQIRSNVARVLLSDKNYKDVGAEVEDGVVTVAGSVVLDSTRRVAVHRLSRRFVTVDSSARTVQS